MFTPVVVAAAIVDDLTAPTRILGAERSYPEKWRGFFEFPGGKTEPGEPPEEALRRELREELSVEVVVGPRLPQVWPAHGGYDMYVYLCVFAPGAIPQVGDAHLSLEWVDLVDPLTIKWLPADHAILAAIQTHSAVTRPKA